MIIKDNAAAVLVEKTVAAKADDNPLEYIMSDDSVDRMGDVIEPDGWKLGNFKKNPIAFFGHDSRFIVGNWTKVRVENGALRGQLALMEPVTDRLKEIITAVKAGIIRAVSVGFRPIKSELIEGSKNGGIRFIEQELVECSLVGVPANPNALQVAKSLNLSPDTMSMIFGKTANEAIVIRRGLPGQAAGTLPVRNTGMTTIAERIQNAQDSYLAAKTELESHLAGLDDNDVTDAQLARTNVLNQNIKSRNEILVSLKDAEMNLASTASPVHRDVVTTSGSPVTAVHNRPFAMPVKKVNPIDYFIRAATVKVICHQTKMDQNLIRQKAYGDDLPTKIITDMVTRAATAPADTTTVGWAAELVQTINAEFMETLAPDAVYPQLSALGLRLTFGRNGVISIPTRSATPTIAGSFVGEGAPIPVRQGAFTATTLTPKKMAVISTMTREISEHSIPAIEGLIRDAIQEDTGTAVDTVLLDAGAATAIRPPGLLNGVAAIGATAGGGLAALVGDITALSAALVTGTNGKVRRPVWIMNPTSANAISLVANGLGLFPFRDEINSAKLNRWPVIESGTVTAGVVILVDAADFVSVTGDDPRFDVSDQATLHMEDTTPLAIGTVAGPPNTVAAPVRSLWQTDSIGIRMILPMNWALRRTGIVRWTQAVTWD